MPKSAQQGRRTPGALLALSFVSSLHATVVGAQETVVLEGEIPASESDYFVIPFDVPAGIEEIEIAHDDLSAENILDFGVWSPDGFRGWGGGNSESAIIGRLASSRSYRVGPMTPGTWEVVVGKAKIVSPPGAYRVEITWRETPTLAPDPARGPYEPVVVSSETRFFAGDFHVHSRESGDADATLDEIAELARARGLDFVVITDHNTDTHVELLASAQARHPDVLFIPGCEFTTYAGHVGATGATSYVDHRIGYEGHTVEAALAQYADDGVLVTVNHPVLDLGDLCIGCAWGHGDDALADAHAVEIMTGGNTLFLENALAFWDSKLDRGYTLAAIGGSDDHRAGRDTGFAAARIGTPTTMVYADGLSTAAIVEGVRQGLTVVRLAGAEGPMVELAMDALRVGATVFFNAGSTTMSLPVRVMGGEGHELRLLRDGFVVDDGVRAIERSDATVIFEVAAEAGARYRAELWSEGRPVVVTSHVFTEPMLSDDVVGCGCASATGPRPVAWLATLAMVVVVRRARRRT